MADNINDIVGQESFSQLDRLNTLLDTSAQKLRDLTNQVINIEVNYSGAGARDQLNNTNNLVGAQNRARRSSEELNAEVREYNKLVAGTVAAQARLSEANRGALTEYTAVRTALANTNREIRDNVRLTSDATGAYDKMNIRLRELTNQGKQLGVELGRTAPEYQKIVKQAAQMRAELQSIDEDFGQYGRNVGNYRSAYNGLAASFNQLTRELPALAINANTFFLAISNNIPIFVDELRRATAANRALRVESEAAATAAQKQAVAAARAAGATELQAKAAGDLARQQSLANSQTTAGVSLGTQLFKAIFSWQTLLSVAVGLITVYGGKLVEAFSGGTSAADRFNDALKETSKATANDVAELLRLQAALSSNTTNRLDLQKAIDDARSKYPEYLGLLGNEAATTQQINLAIQDQIKLIETRAKQKAAEEALSKAVEEHGEAEAYLGRALSGNLGFWEKTQAFIISNTQQFKGLSTEQAAVIDAMQAVTKTQNELTTAQQMAVDPVKEQISQAILYQSRLRDEITELERLVKTGHDTFGSYQSSINAKRSLIATTEELINMLARERAQTLLTGKTTLTDNQLASLNAQTRVLNAKKGSEEETRLRREARMAQLKVEEDALRAEYQIGNANLDFNKEYQAKLANLRAKAEDDLEKQVRTRSTNTAKFINQEYKANEDLNKALAEFQAQRLKADQAYRETLISDTKLSLDERLAAHERYIQDEQDLYDLESGVEIANLYNRLEKIEELRKLKANQSKAAQEALAKDEEAIQTRLDTLVATREFNRTRIALDGTNKRRQILQSSAEEEARNIERNLQDIENANTEALNRELAELDMRARSENMSQQRYNNERKRIVGKANEDLYKQQRRYLTEMLYLNQQLVEMSDISPEKKQEILGTIKEIGDQIGKLVNPREYVGPGESASILNLLGFGNDPELLAQLDSKNESIVAAAVQRIVDRQKAILVNSIEQLKSTLFNLLDAARDAQFQAEFDRIDEEKRKLDELTEARRLAVDSELLSEEQKQRRLAEINAEAAAQEKSLDNERRQLQREQAQRQKDDAIFQIAINGAIAAAQALATIVPGQPATVATAIASAAIIAAATAAAIAVAASRPLPSYFEGAGPGTPNPSHPGGPAVLHGSEKVTLPSGKSFITPGAPNTGLLMDLPQGTNVTPNSQLMLQSQQKAIAQLSAPGTSVNENSYAEALIGAFQSEIGDLKNVIKNKQVLNIDFYNGQMRGVIRRQHSQEIIRGRIKGSA